MADYKVPVNKRVEFGLHYRRSQGFGLPIIAGAGAEDPKLSRGDEIEYECGTRLLVYREVSAAENLRYCGEMNLVPDPAQVRWYEVRRVRTSRRKNAKA